MTAYDLYALPLKEVAPQSDAMILYVLNRDLERIGIVSEFESLVWTSRIWDHSKVALKCGLGALPDGAAFLQRSDTLEAVWIRRFHPVREKDELYLEVQAIGATALFKGRVNWWTKDFVDVNLATAAAELTADAQATYAGIDRTISGMGALVDLTRSATLITKQVSWGQVDEAIFELVRAAGLWFGVRYGGIGLQPFIRRGYDRTASVVFSTEYSDVSDTFVDINRESAANLAVVAGEGEGAARVVTTAEVPDGDELIELFVDARDLQKSEEMTDAEYLATLQQRGAEKIADLPLTTTVEGTVVDTRFAYREDFDLGDIVTFFAFGYTVEDIVSEVTETIESGEKRIDIALGQTAPTIRKLLR